MKIWKGLTQEIHRQNLELLAERLTGNLIYSRDSMGTVHSPKYQQFYGQSPWNLGLLASALEATPVDVKVSVFVSNSFLWKWNLAFAINVSIFKTLLDFFSHCLGPLEAEMRYQSCGTLWFFAPTKSPWCQENPVFLPSSRLVKRGIPSNPAAGASLAIPRPSTPSSAHAFLARVVQGQVHRAFSSRLLVWGQSGRRAQPIPLLFSIRFRPLGHTVLFQQRGRCPAILWDRKNHQAGLFVSQRLRLLDEVVEPQN